MKSKHVAFCVEQAYGHIIPTIGITLELIRRGHRVSYAVVESFAPLIARIGATPIVIQPLETRMQMWNEQCLVGDPYHYKREIGEVQSICSRISSERTLHSLPQLERLYRQDRPDVILYDSCLDTAGRALASKWRIAKIRHYPQFMEPQWLNEFLEDELVLLPVPKFFQPDLTTFDLDPRFKFIGFVPEGRTQVFEPWRPPREMSKPILVSATTGIDPQLAFCEVMIDALRAQPRPVILSISGSSDALSAIDPSRFKDVSRNIYVNRTAGNFAILENASLYIGQGGQGGTLEAIYWGVPQIVVPPTPNHYSVARRVVELGFGASYAIGELSPESIREHVAAMLDDKITSERVRAAAISMRDDHAAECAADTVEKYIA